MSDRYTTFRRTGLALLALVAAIAHTPQLAAAPVPAERFQTTPTMRDETRNLIGYLEHRHYLQMKLDGISPDKLISEYLQTLDPKHLYFTEREVQEIQQKYGPTLRSELQRGQLSIAFALYLDFRQRVMERNQWIFQRLEQPFTFTGDSTYEPDRSKAPWPLNRDDLTDIWEKQIRYELLNEMLSLMVPDKKDDKADAAGKDAKKSPKADDSDKPKAPLSEAEALKEAITTVKKRYERQLQWLQETDPDEVQEIFLSTLTRLYDPHSTFMSATSREEFNMAISNSLIGIGAVLSDVDGYCTIKKLMPAGPAERSGKLKAEDQIVGVGQGLEGEMVDVIGMRLSKIVKMIRGPLHTKVRLLIRPADADPSERKTVVLTRDKVKLTEQLAQARLYSLPAPAEQPPIKIGVIDLPAFYGPDKEEAISNTTTFDVAELIGKLKADGMQGLVLDLRSNGGGLLGEAINLAGLFLPSGPVVQVRNHRGAVQGFGDSDPAIAWDGPLVVLVSRFSASASEIVAGALRDNHRALIIGDETTHGKGTVQAIFEMAPQTFFSMLRNTSSGAAKITVQKYYLPRGDSTQIDGVRADIPLPSFNRHLPIGEGDLPNAMPHDTIAPIDWEYGGFTKDGVIGIDEELIGTLLQTSLGRQDALPEFDFLKNNIEVLRQRQEEKKLSLNLEKRIEQRRKDREIRKTMDERLEVLSKNPYPFEKILLDAAIAQKAEQDANLAALKEENGSAADAAEQNTATTTKAEATGEQPQAGTAQAENATAKADEAETADTVANAEKNTAKATGNNDEDDADEDEDSKEPRMDIHLREALRIMADWLEVLRNAPTPAPQLPVEAIATNEGAAAQAGN